MSGTSTTHTVEGHWHRRLLVPLVVFEAALAVVLLEPVTVMVAAGILAVQLAVTFVPRQPFDLVLVLLVDVLALAGLLALAGGAANPFSVAMLFPITLGAVTLSPWRSAGVVLAAVLAYATLFFVGDAHGDHDGFASHLQGMWVAFTLTAFGIAWAIGLVRSALEAERDRADRTMRVVGMTTLAAGAAHELATPLSTIKTVIAELERELAEARPSVRDDLRLIRSEVMRGRAILDRLAVAAGELRGEAPALVSLPELASALDDLAERDRRRVRFVAADARVVLPKLAVHQALLALVRNALEASVGEVDGMVDVRIASATEGVTVTVEDRGAGMDASFLEQLGQPFLTSKRPGEGMGLGVFLVQALAAHLGGELRYASTLGVGTTATLELPCRVENVEGA